jgi:peptidoglycan hydrolase-like protein with peptidoglycan-binding domain
MSVQTEDFQKDRELKVTGEWGNATHNLARYENLFDQYGNLLLGHRAAPLTRTLTQGKQMSGDDVDAVARALWRLGYRPPDQDRVGIDFGPKMAEQTKAFQTDRGLEPTGEWAGPVHDQACALVGFDDYACQLLRGYQPMPTPAPVPVETLAQARLRRAQGEIGTKESPPSSNHQKYGEWYRLDYQPWCAIFVTWADQVDGTGAASFVRGSYYSYVPYIVSDALAARRGLSKTTSPQPGDLACFDWSGDAVWDHIEIVETPPDDAGNFVTVGGNTSTSSDSDGGEVMRRQRNRYSQGTVFVRVAEP